MTHHNVLVPIIAATAIMAGLTACSPSPDAPATPIETADPAPGKSESLQPRPEMPSVELPDGFEVTLELAITPDELAQGLMFRPKLPDDRGMLLIFGDQRFPSIWMMNTLVALDLIFLDDTGLVIDVVEGAQPCPSEPCPRFSPKQPARAVLEVPAGVAARHQVVSGERLPFTRVPDFPAE